MTTSAFVDQLYLTFLGRPADTAGRAHWSQQIDAGAVTAAEVTRQFLDSAEFADAVAPVARLYYSAFDRIPDAAGLGFWIKSAQAGMPLDAIADAFALSPEFAKVYGAARNPDFINLIYQNALGRAPDAAVKAHWVEQLAQGQVSRADVLGAIAASAEMAATSAAAIKVIAQYHGITGSAPTQPQIDAALLHQEPLVLINQLFASSGYHGAPVPHPFVADHVATSHGGGGTIGDNANKAPVIVAGDTGPTDGVTPSIVLAFSQDVHAAGGVIYITDGAAQTVIDRATNLPVTRIVGATDTRAFSVNDTSHVAFDGGQVTITVSAALKSGLTYSVLIGKGVIAGANDMPFGGISDSTTLHFTPVGDATAPTVEGIGLDLATYQTGDTATLTIEFSEAIQTLTAAAFDAPNGALSDFATIDGGRTWTAVFTPAEATDDTSNAITLRAGAVRDLAGNLNTAAASTGNYVVDTVVTAVVDSKLEFNDTGISSTDRLTNDASQTLSGKFVGAAAGTTLKVVVNGTAHDVTPNADKTWTLSSDEFTEGMNTVLAYFTNPAGHSSAQRSLSFTLDTVAPQVTGLPELVDPATALVLSFSEKVYWTDPAATIVFESASGNVTVAASAITWSANGTQASVGGANLLAAGANYTIKLPASLTDAAGNPVATPAAFGTSGVATDTTPPVAPAAPDLIAASDSGSLDSDNITFETLPNFAGSAGTVGDTVKLYAGAIEVASGLVASDGTWQLAPSTALANGVHAMTAKYIDAAGNASTASEALDVTIDTVAPTLVSPAASPSVQVDDYLNLQFSESIKFLSGGLHIKTDGGILAHLFQVIHGAAWQIGAAASGNSLSTLTLTPDVNFGSYTLEIDANSIFDLAGNAYVSVVGVPVATFHV